MRQQAQQLLSSIYLFARIAMLTYLPVFFFFAALFGAPVLGLLVFSFMGMGAAWQAWRHPQKESHWVWTTQDKWLALSFMSILFFKLLSVAWSDKPMLALSNAGWHLYFLFWPLVLLGLNRCKTTQAQADKAIALGLIFTALWRSTYALTGWDAINPGASGTGLLAQLAMTMGAWNLLALTRPDDTPPRWRAIQGLAVLCTLIILVISFRRQELLEFIALAAGILAYRQRRHITIWKAIVGALIILGLLGLLVAIRWDKFVLGFNEVVNYFELRHQDPKAVLSSVGARLEMWRVGWAAFCDHPWLGLSASVRPYELQQYGAPLKDVFGHRHFHQQFLQTLVEGGLVGLIVMLISLGYSTRAMIIKPFKTQPETALLAAALLGSYFMEGLISAALVYDKPNALLVVTSAWLWIQLRRHAA